MLAVKIRRKALCVTLSLGCALFAFSTQAEIYQWKDADGNTVFSEKPPPDAQKSVVKPRYGKAAPPAPTVPQKSASPQKKDVAAKDDKPAPKEPTPEEKQKKCAQARASLDQLNNGGRLRVADDKGVVSFMSDEQRAERAKKANESIKSWCGK
jgi:Domain of unknown function (DUF4124)